MFLFIKIVRLKKEIKMIESLNESNIRVGQELFKLYSQLQETQILMIKAYDLSTQKQKDLEKDVEDFRVQVSDAVLAVADHLEGLNESSAVKELFAAKDTKIKPN